MTVKDFRVCRAVCGKRILSADPPMDGIDHGVGRL